MNISEFVDILRSGPEESVRLVLVSRQHQLSGYVTSIREDDGEVWIRLGGAKGQWAK